MPVTPLCRPSARSSSTLGPGFGALEIRGEPRHVEPEGAGVLDDPSLGHRLVAVVDPVVHLPEPALLAGSLGGERDARRSRMGALVREVAEDVNESSTHGLPKAQHDSPEALAVGTEEIAVSNDLNRVTRAATADVVSRRIDRLFEVYVRRARR